MRFRILIGLVLVILGIIFSIYALYSIISKVEGFSIENVALLILGCILMVCGALFRYTERIDEIEEELEHPKTGETSSWKVQDLEYRLKKIEKEKGAESENLIEKVEKELKSKKDEKKREDGMEEIEEIYE